MVFYDEPLEKVTPHVFCMNFMMGSVEAILRDESRQKFFCRQVIIGPLSSKMPMIIAKIVMYVKFMHKGPLRVAFYIPYPLEDLLKNGELI
jgi:hypothetical protein